MRVLARRVAELHVALARRTGDAAFDPEPASDEDVARWARNARDECLQTLARLRDRAEPWPEPLRDGVAQAIGAESALLSGIEAAAASGLRPLKTRVHGDLHLGQVLVCRDDFVLIDFEGEPGRGFEERRVKTSALRDVAGMLRSFDYARHAALQAAAAGEPGQERLAPLARRWEREMRAAFLESYADTVVEAGLYADRAAFAAAAVLLRMFELEKALYELRYEMDNRPDWIGVPLAGIAALAGVDNSSRN
ncbi:MAG TPA: hypothetical protein PLG77_13740 [Burkholderiaceae bacterium]|nr:hypothetical protein [Burkholderiaceae bacterium]